MMCLLSTGSSFGGGSAESNTASLYESPSPSSTTSSNSSSKELKKIEESPSPPQLSPQIVNAKNNILYVETRQKMFKEDLSLSPPMLRLTSPPPVVAKQVWPNECNEFEQLSQAGLPIIQRRQSVQMTFCNMRQNIFDMKKKRGRKGSREWRRNNLVRHTVSSASDVEDCCCNEEDLIKPQCVNDLVKDVIRETEHTNKSIRDTDRTIEPISDSDFTKEYAVNNIRDADHTNDPIRDSDHTNDPIRDSDHTKDPISDADHVRDVDTEEDSDGIISDADHVSQIVSDMIEQVAKNSELKENVKDKEEPIPEKEEECGAEKSHSVEVENITDEKCLITCKDKSVGALNYAISTQKPCPLRKKRPLSFIDQCLFANKRRRYLAGDDKVSPDILESPQDLFKPNNLGDSIVMDDEELFCCPQDLDEDSDVELHLELEDTDEDEDEVEAKGDVVTTDPLSLDDYCNELEVLIPEEVVVIGSQLMTQQELNCVIPVVDLFEATPLTSFACCGCSKTYSSGDSYSINLECQVLSVTCHQCSWWTHRRIGTEEKKIFQCLS